MITNFTKVDTTFETVTNPIIGRDYHLSWAYRGCFWELMKINNDGTCLLRTGRGKKLTAKLSDLRELRH